MDSSDQLKMTVYASLFAALIAAGAFMAIPIGPVPIVLQNMFVLLAGIILGPRWGLASVGVYLLMGALGFPVFAGGTGGLGRLFGPTGGYLLSYLPAVFITGLVSRALGNKTRWDILAMAAGSMMIYSMGVPWLKLVTGMAWGKAFAVGMYPFIIGDLLKITAGAFSAGIIRPVINTPALKKKTAE
ncbi:MAG: biotin transporter BioY [Desulfobacteraceae bacterium]